MTFILQLFVLLVTYMRGGSSFLGELFNQHEDAMYYFEPINGVYKALYGTEDDWNPLTITHHRNGTERSPFVIPIHIFNLFGISYLLTLSNVYDKSFLKWSLGSLYATYY